MMLKLMLMLALMLMPVGWVKDTVVYHANALASKYAEYMEILNCCQMINGAQNSKNGDSQTKQIHKRHKHTYAQPSSREQERGREGGGDWAIIVWVVDILGSCCQGTEKKPANMSFDMLNISRVALQHLSGRQHKNPRKTNCAYAK